MKMDCLNMLLGEKLAGGEMGQQFKIHDTMKAAGIHGSCCHHGYLHASLTFPAHILMLINNYI